MDTPHSQPNAPGEYLLPTFVKHKHAKACNGNLYRTNKAVYIDRLGRIGNGGCIAYDYRCNKRWNGCEVRMLAEHAIDGTGQAKP